MASWLTAPVQLTGSRDFECGDYTPEQCAYYTERWHFWYIADYVYALPTVAFFMSVLGIFILGHLLSSQVLGYRKFQGPHIWQKLIAGIRYLSYRGFHVKKLQWNTAPIGILLLGAVGAVYFFCMDLIPQPYYWSTEDYGGSPPLGTRSGWMALACMPFVFATASKTNWITLLTGVSHERIQVFHRWSAYAFFLLALMHTFPFIMYHVRFHDMMMQVTMNALFYWTGIVALVFQAWLTFASHSMIRHLNYEFFKAAHFFAVAVFVVVFFWHCDYTLTSWHYFIATAAVYVPCAIYPWLRTAFEYGFAQKAQIEVENNGFIRLTIPAVNMRWKPGQHCFLRFTSFGMQAFTSHPFTICSLPSSCADTASELVFYIRHSGGLTKKLFEYAQKNPGTPVPVLIDGPYGGINMQRYSEADRLLVIAGGSGAGWLLPFIELFCRQGSSLNSTTFGKDVEAKDEEHQARLSQSHRSLRVVLATRDIASRTWFLDAVTELFAKHATAQQESKIQIDVHSTGEAEAASRFSKQMDVTTDQCASSSSSNDIELHSEENKVAVSSREARGRPELPHVIHQEGMTAAEESRSLGVYVCGPITMQHDVRNAVAKENLSILRGVKSGGVYLHSEHFSWA